jgi:hypothetical protein
MSIVVDVLIRPTDRAKTPSRLKRPTLRTAIAIMSSISEKP